MFALSESIGRDRMSKNTTNVCIFPRKPGWQDSSLVKAQHDFGLVSRFSTKDHIPPDKKINV